MTIEEEIRKVLVCQGGTAIEFDLVDATRDLAKCIERYGIAMHDRGNFHRKPWGYVPEDRQEKARHAAVEAFTGGGG